MNNGLQGEIFIFARTIEDKYLIYIEFEAKSFKLETLIIESSSFLTFSCILNIVRAGEPHLIYMKMLIYGKTKSSQS